MPRSVRRRSTPSSPAKSKEPTVEPQHTRRTARTRAHEPSATPVVAKSRRVKNRLGPVEEESDTIVLRDPQLVQRDVSAHEGTTQEEDYRRLQSSRRVPSIRATIHDSIAPTELRVDSMVKHLTELDFRADEVLSQLDMYTTQQLLENLDDRQSPVWDDFNENASMLESERQYYGTDTEFLRIDLLLQEMTNKILPTAGAEHIFTKANLALFFYRLLEAHPIELHNLFVILTSEQTFPKAFMGRNFSRSRSSVEYGDDFRYQTTSVGLDILAQCFLFKARRNIGKNDFDHGNVLREIFFREKGSVRNVSLGMTSSTEQRGYIESMKDTMSKIEQIVSTDEGQSINLAALEAHYPWTGFLAEALAWVRVRIEQIDLAIRQEGGVRAIKRGLQQSSVVINSRTNKGKPRPSRADEDFAEKISFLRNIDENLNAGEADSQAPEEEEEETPSRADVEKAATQAVRPPPTTRILREIISESPGVREQSQTIQVQVQDQDQDQDQSHLINDDEPIEDEIPDSAQSPSGLSVIRPTQETSAVLRVIQRQAKEGNKENSPPAEPTRVPNRQTSTVRSNSGMPEQIRSSQKGKRRQRDDEDAESDEDAFESDQRQNKRPRPHPGKAAEPANSVQPNGSDVFLANTDEPDEQSRPSTQPPQQRTHNSHNRPGPSTQPAPAPAPTQPRTNARSLSANPTGPPSSTLPPSSFHEEYMKIKHHARVNTSFAAAVAPPTAIRLPQVRRAWTPEEIERLLFLMGKHGCGWAAIKKADDRMVDPQLLDRSQVQLKDKARNIKMDFLKAEQPLPECLSIVTISKSHKQMLKAMNIAYPGEEFEEE